MLIPGQATQAQVFDYMSYDQDFDDTLRFNLEIDTTDGHGGLWQIGAPQKSTFNAALSVPNVIVTDTLQPYPPNDTSSFIITNLAGYGWIAPHTAILAGYYWIDASPGDSGKIEISFDQGDTWLDLLNDPLINSYIAGSSLYPQLTGASGGWQYFYLSLASLHFYAINELGSPIELGDSIQYRFTFTSDGVDDPHDGLMYDNLHFEDYVEGIAEHAASTFHSSVVSNPVHDILDLLYAYAGPDAPLLVIHDAQGKRCLETRLPADHRCAVDVSSLGAGLYTFELRAANGARSFGRFVEQR